ncbi:MAG TPA: hypothetical protein ENJ55_01505 [Rhizobiales bacterium]|nr:hypothetical protein [Hyphomicrobiales bacterium]
MAKKLSAALVTTAAIFLASSLTTANAGPITGNNGHKASGTARLSGSSVKLGSDFRFDGGPDVYVAVRKKGQKVKLISKLKTNSGAQSYKLPTGSKKKDVDQILLWCKRYNVPLGSASPN